MRTILEIEGAVKLIFDAWFSTRANASLRFFFNSDGVLCGSIHVVAMLDEFRRARHIKDDASVVALLRSCRIEPGEKTGAIIEAMRIAESAFIAGLAPDMYEQLIQEVLPNFDGQAGIEHTLNFGDLDEPRRRDDELRASAIDALARTGQFPPVDGQPGRTASLFANNPIFPRMTR